jgi:uncharacterized protein
VQAFDQGDLIRANIEPARRGKHELEMKCPACSRVLTEKPVGSLCVQVCQGGCGGIWFDTFELNRVLQEDDAVSESLLQIQRDRDVIPDPAQPRCCPRCVDARLNRVLFGPGSRSLVDECPKCGGCWFDDGVLARLQDEGQLRAEAGPAGASFDLMAYLFELRTGHRKR